MAAGFLVPFLSGGIIKALETRDEYDENAYSSNIINDDKKLLINFSMST